MILDSVYETLRNGRRNAPDAGLSTFWKRVDRARSPRDSVSGIDEKERSRFLAGETFPGSKSSGLIRFNGRKESRGGEKTSHPLSGCLLLELRW